MDEIINNDIQAKKAGLIIGISNEIYFMAISKTSTVYVEWIDTRWMAWRETYILNSSKRKGYKRIAHGEFEEVIQRVKGYLEFIQNNQKAK
ncbi:pathogenicity island protein [Staphylococcus arlettae]|uniref:pathogenicity island protein n=1 Tax=Staphylococcus arlettae TaxID=29378 RepID=UPI003132DC7D